MFKQEYWLGVLRISLGLIFLWAFFDKFFGLGFATARGSGWLFGHSITEGFLLHGTKGPLAFLFQALAGNVFVEWIFMVGLLGIGTGLMFGIAKKLSCFSGIIMLVLMWLAVLPPEHHPFLDDHLIYSVALFILAFAKTKLGFEEAWKKTRLVKRFPWLE